MPDNMEKVLRKGKNRKKKELIRNLLDRMTMASESLEIEIILKAPEPLVNSVVEGACFEPATSSMPGNRLKLNFKLEKHVCDAVTGSWPRFPP